MSKPVGRSWWSSMGFVRKTRTPARPDFADMGTAFGLDASMESLPRPTFAEGRAVDHGRAPGTADPALRSR